MTPLLRNYRVNDAIEMMKPFNKETVAPFDVSDLGIRIICHVLYFCFLFFLFFFRFQSAFRAESMLRRTHIVVRSGSDGGPLQTLTNHLLILKISNRLHSLHHPSTSDPCLDYRHQASEKKTTFCKRANAV